MSKHDKCTRRDVMKAGLAGLAAASLEAVPLVAPAVPRALPMAPDTSTRFLTPARAFLDVSRGNPVPHTLRGEALVRARLTPETWRLEIVADTPARVARSYTLQEGTALDLAGLQKLGKTHGVKFLKAIQCLNIPQPLGQGLWEGVPLRDVLRLLGRLENVRRVYYWGYHNDDPKQLFQSSLSYTQAMETPPGELPAFLAYRLNGEPLPLERGGPVRMVIPWAHGFKSIKWLQRIVVTNDYRANDTYAEANNDPESHLKTAAYLGPLSETFKAGTPVLVQGTAIAGLSGLKRVEYWVRPSEGRAGDLAEDDPAWEKAKWVACQLESAPEDWRHILPADVSAKEILGFDPTSGKPKSWPMRYSMVSWSAVIKGLAPGRYEVRARAVDQNGFAQPEPRPYLKSGLNPIQVGRFDVTR